MKPIGEIVAGLTWEVIWGFIKKLLENQIARWVMIGLTTFGFGWCGHEAKVALFDTSNLERGLAKRDSILFSRLQHLSDKLTQAQSLNFSLSSSFEKYVDSTRRARLDRATNRKIDELLAQGEKIQQMIAGQGKVHVAGSGPVMGLEYSDHWLSGVFDTTNGKWSFNYGFNFYLDRVSFITTDNRGVKKNIYQASIRSMVDTNDVIQLNDYIEELASVIIPPVDDSKMWQDPALSLGFFLGSQMTGGLIYSPWMISSGGNTPKAVILRYPAIAVSTNFKNSTVVSLGAALNVAHYMPAPFEDTSIFLGYGYDFKLQSASPQIGLSTTL